MMENVKLYSDRNMIDYAKTVADFRLPRWEQIPALGLYMDQVITVIDQALSPLIGFGEEATAVSTFENPGAQVDVFAITHGCKAA